MIYLAAQRVAKHFGPDPVLAGVTVELRPGEKVGLVGPNGTGKTTLMKILAGQLDADAGSVERHSSASLGFLEQQPDFTPGRTVWDEARSALDHLLSLAEEAEQLAHAMSGADETERRRLGQRFDWLQTELHRHDAYHLDHKIERILGGLGFPSDAFRQPVEQLSGGQQNRLLLAKLLLAEPDVLLLDEPSNHLDIEATEWLEEYLIDSRQALIVVSHDRYFLDRVTNRTWELFNGTVDAYVGNFSAYWRQKAERLEVQRRTWERQQEEIAKLEDFVRRNHYGQKATQAEDRRKKLERIERVEPPREIAAPKMQFPEAARTGDIVLRVERLAKSFDRPLFRGLSFDVLRGERWGILGPNGSGKTTLLRCILGELPADEGKVIFGAGVKAGYFDQQLKCVESDVRVMDAVRPSHKEFVEQERRNLLARFGVTGDMAYQKVSSLSGGERNRVALAMLAASDANVLILDEPTNHLDLWARDALERAIEEFDGTVLFVSHDRYFLNRVADHVLVVEPNRFRVVEGDYDTYQHLVRAGLARGEASISDTTARPDKSADGKAKPDGAEKAGKPPREPRRKRKFPYRKLEEIEAEIAERESRIEALHAALASPEVLRSGDKVKQTKAEIEDQQQTLATLYEHWEEAAELNA